MSRFTYDFAGGAGALGAVDGFTQQATTDTVNRNGSGGGVGSAGVRDMYVFCSAFSPWGPDQAAEITIGTGLASLAQYAQLVVRSSGVGDANQNLYEFYTDGVTGATHSEIAKKVAGTTTVLASVAATFAAGDRIRLEVRGARLYVYKNGVLLASVLDTAWSHKAGSPGCGVFGTTIIIDDFAGEDIPAPAGSPSYPPNLPGPWQFARQVPLPVPPAPSAPSVFVALVRRTLQAFGTRIGSRGKRR